MASISRIGAEMAQPNTVRCTIKQAALISVSICKCAHANAFPLDPVQQSPAQIALSLTDGLELCWRHIQQRASWMHRCPAAKLSSAFPGLH